MKLKKRNLFRIIWFSLVAIFFVWNWNTFQAHNLPESTFENSSQVELTETDDQLIFEAVQNSKGIEVIFFPGGLTDPEAYTPLARNLAEQGYTTYIIKMPFRMAQMGYEKISTLFDFNNGSKKYVLGGHSQGAKMAAQYVYENPEALNGLFLLGTSHPRDINLHQLTIPAIKLYAEHDGLASVSEVMENEDKLPKNTKLILIEGGNHSQFGYLGHLLTDDEATITRKQQQKQTLKHLLDFFDTIK